jgi:hypothetical protein
VAVSLHSIGESPTTLPLLGLLDSGGSHVMIQRNCLPPNCIETPTNKPITFITTAGQFLAKTSVTLKDISLPEFNKALRVPVTNAFVFDSPSTIYNIILGRPFLRDTNIQLDFAKNEVHWLDFIVPFCSVRKVCLLDCGCQLISRVYIYRNMRITGGAR